MDQRAQGGKFPEPGGDNLFRRLWHFVTGTWPGRIAAIVGFVPTAWAAWQIGEHLFIPARVTVELECHPRLIVIHARNGGGRAATLGDPSFQMLSVRRWEDREWHDRNLSALANPLDRDRELSAHEPQRYEYRPGFPLYESDEIGGENCQFKVTLPYTSSRGRHEPAEKACICES